MTATARTTTTRTARRGTRTVVVGLVLGVAALAGCGDDDESAQDRYCAAGESLRESVGSLTEVDLVAEGTDGLTAAVDEIRDDVGDLSDAASDAAEDEVTALQVSVDDLRAALDALGGEITGDNVSAVAAAVEAVATSARAVYGTLADC